MNPFAVSKTIVGTANTGAELSIKLLTLAEQVTAASGRIHTIANSVALASAVLQQLGRLVCQRVPRASEFIFNDVGLRATMASARVCSLVFEALRNDFEFASGLIRSIGMSTGGHVKLSVPEVERWPFLQPRFEFIRVDLAVAREDLTCFLQVAQLAASRIYVKVGFAPSLSFAEEQYIAGFLMNIQAQGQFPHQSRTEELSPVPEPKKDPKIIVDNASFEDVSSDRNSTIVVEENPLTMEKLQSNTGSQSSILSEKATKKSKPMVTASFISSSETIRSHKTITTRNLWQSVLQKFCSSRGGTKLPEVQERIQTEPETGPLQLYTQKPLVADFADGVEISWSTRMQAMEQEDIEKQLARDRRWRRPSLVKQIAKLSREEDRSIQDLLYELDHEAALVSVIKTTENIRYKGMILRKVPSVRFILRLEPTKEVVGSRVTGRGGNYSIASLSPYNYDAPKLEKPKPVDPNKDSVGDPDIERHIRKNVAAFDSNRPTYVRVNRKFISPETLREYDLPWVWDHTNSDFIIIKQWIPLHYQDILFAHTRNLRSRGLCNRGIVPSQPGTKGKGDLNVDSAIPPLVCRNESTKNNHLDDLLAKYTTLLDIEEEHPGLSDIKE